MADPPDDGPRDEGRERRPPTVPYATQGPDRGPRPSRPSPDADGLKLPDPADRIGAVLAGRYRLDAVLGSGGMATVYACHDTQLDRDVAVKVLQDAIATDEELRARFDREAKVLAALSHPHVVSLLDFGVDDGTPFLVMELLEGRSLGEVLRDAPRLPWDRAVRLITQIVGAVSYAHSQGFLHRDLKPDNVFLTELESLGDHARVLDFGFAKLTAPGDDERKLTATDRVFGTPRYLAPEQLTGNDVDARADLYAIGVLFFQMLAGRRPFEGTIREVLRAKALEDAPSLAKVAPDAPTSPRLEAFLAKALARHPDDRFEDCKAFLSALEALEDPSEPEAPEDPTLDRVEPALLEELRIEAPAPSPAPRVSRAPATAAAAIPAVGLLLGCGGLAAVGALGLGWLVLGAGDDAQRDAAAAAADVAPAEPAPAPSQAPAADDPWRDAILAPPVAAVRQDVLVGLPVEGGDLRALRAHARAHPDDVHAQLLLGHVFTQRELRAMAVQRYERALRLDRGAADDPHLVVDLVALAAEEGAGEGPRRLLRTYLPGRAAPVVTRALARADLDPPRRQRLEALQRDLQSR